MNHNINKELESFKKNFKEYTRLFYNSIESNKEDVYAFGVFTDQDIATFVLYYDTKSSLLKKGIISQLNDNIWSNTQEAQIWWMPQWKGSDSDGNGNEVFGEELLDQMEKIGDKIEFSEYKSLMFDLFCTVLKELKEEGIFIEIENNLLLLVQESDNFMEEKDETSLKKIMSKEQWDSYLVFNSNNNTI